MKDRPLRPETFLGSALSSPSLLTDRAMHDLGGLEGFLSGTAASPETQRNKVSPNKLDKMRIRATMAKHKLKRASCYRVYSLW